MKKWLIIAVSLAIAIVLFMYTKGEAKAAGMTLGYTTGDTASYNSLAKYHTYMNAIATDTFAFEKNGQIIGDAPSKQLTYAKKKKSRHGLSFQTIMMPFMTLTEIWQVGS